MAGKGGCVGGLRLFGQRWFVFDVELHGASAYMFWGHSEKKNGAIE